MSPRPAKRAWMVRGSNVDGFNLVPEWLRDGFVSLSASQLADLDPGCRLRRAGQAVETGYQHKSYAYRGQRLEEFDRFMRRMRAGDLVLTPMHGGVYIGEVAGPAHFAESAAPHSNLRRTVRWFNPAEPIDGSRLRAPVPALLQSQAYIVDLTEAYEQLAALVPHAWRPSRPSRLEPPDASWLQPGHAGVRRGPAHGPGRTGQDRRSALGAQAGHPVRAAGNGQDLSRQQAGPPPDRRRRGQARPVPPLVHLRGLLRGLPARARRQRNADLHAARPGRSATSPRWPRTTRARPTS